MTKAEQEPRFQSEPLAVGILEGAHIIGVKRSTMYREINAGRIKALKLGKRTVILMATLQAYLDSLPNY